MFFRKYWIYIENFSSRNLKYSNCSLWNIKEQIFVRVGRIYWIFDVQLCFFKFFFYFYSRLPARKGIWLLFTEIQMYFHPCLSRHRFYSFFLFESAKKNRQKKSKFFKWTEIWTFGRVKIGDLCEFGKFFLFAPRGKKTVKILPPSLFFAQARAQKV